MELKTLETQIQAISALPKAPEVRDSTRLSMDQVAHQGDVYLHRVPDDWPRGKELGTRQVAVGDTKGSRHIVEGENVTVHEGTRLPGKFVAPAWLEGMAPEAIFLGPVVTVEGTGTLTHPEHAHHALCGTYQVTYQADARARERVKD